MFMRPPTPPDARARPSGLKANVLTGVMWPFSWKTQTAPSADHREDCSTETACKSNSAPSLLKQILSSLLGLCVRTEGIRGVINCSESYKHLLYLCLFSFNVSFWGKYWRQCVKSIEKWHHPLIDCFPLYVSFSMIFSQHPGSTFLGKTRTNYGTKEALHRVTKTGWGIVFPGHHSQVTVEQCEQLWIHNRNTAIEKEAHWCRRQRRWSEVLQGNTWRGESLVSCICSVFHSHCCCYNICIFL